jgi:hypothetical protein
MVNEEGKGFLLALRVGNRELKMKPDSMASFIDSRQHVPEERDFRDQYDNRSSDLPDFDPEEDDRDITFGR